MRRWIRLERREAATAIQSIARRNAAMDAVARTRREIAELARRQNESAVKLQALQVRDAAAHQRAGQPRLTAPCSLCACPTLRAELAANVHHGVAVGRIRSVRCELVGELVRVLAPPEDSLLGCRLPLVFP